MRMIRHCALALCLLLVLVGCGSQTNSSGASQPQPRQREDLHKPPSDAELSTADFGLPPAENWREQIQSAMSGVLKDPESARYTFVAPDKAWVPLYYVEKRLDPDGGIHVGHAYGWRVDFTVNARNAYGGYVGRESYIGFFQDKKLRALLQPGPDFKDIFGYPFCWVVWPG
jgi:hypothetical protein